MTSQPSIILVRPQLGENIGAAARAMLNFGLTDMRLVAPRDGWPNPKATAMASGATRVLDGARVADDIAGAAEGCDYLFATTARPRDLEKPVHDPEGAMRAAREMIAQGRRVGILFGGERAGLANEDVARAQAIVTVPVNPEFASLNLAQCVLLMSYEWRRGAVEPLEAEAPDVAPVEDIERFARHWEQRLEDSGFFHPPEKAGHMKLTFRNFWSRMPLTRNDVQLMHGALRQLVRRRDG
ncbi:tRNA/rRNA methyltransferase [Palleronia marisminoris]|uniref:tRNA (cytidine/uridine-2'-O-)-methyltransferase TrmJ n=1 Tax=Palleronia marisminoris TaxID=315423 RepID=A0A1Y5R6E8_9RHOB|nr:RNA methyltransferase [Palleronia marisminoris]SFG05375.1 tRNA/rRNA methyltransferase [Palleronia marisminoris]SLN10340.1 tRNA (cytidine/uridine-2'-O-)-methyltransferase TrmJ [Palleronia marisminoris]